MPVAVGIDGCKGGWIAAVEHEAGDVDLTVFARFEDLVAALPQDAVLAVDMPIGLPERCDAGGRGPERLARPLLGQRQSSVFSVPSRAAVHAASDEEMALDWYGAHRKASAAARATSQPPRAVSIQGFGLFRKMRELDALLIAKPLLRPRIMEAHPELAFWRMNGRRPLLQPKKVRGSIYPPGMAERRSLLAGEGLPEELFRFAPTGAGLDDALDALAVLTVARRAVEGVVERLPDPPAHDSQGLMIAIHF